MTWRNALLRAYPRSWREEYGEEFAALLARRRLTLSVVADVLAGGIGQHVQRDTPWKICGMGYLFWTLSVKPAAVLFHSRPALLWYAAAGFLFLFFAGALSMRNMKVGLWSATAASAKAALPGQIGTMLLYVDVVRRVGSALVQGHTVYFWCGKTLLLNLAISLAFGFAGAVTTRLRRTLAV